MFAALAALALVIEAAFGYPDAVYRRIGHPVTWLGGLIAWCDRHWNRDADSPSRRRLMGVVTLLVLITVAALAGVVVWHAAVLVAGPIAGFVITALAASTLVAQRSLHTHVEAVADALETGGLVEGRRAVSMIVGRDPDRLDEAGVARAAIESLAENFSDGVVAPLFWMVVGGLPGALVYKAINTADSMIGHKTARHTAFGWAAARTDDLVNLPASRLAALWIVVAANRTDRDDGAAAISAIVRDAGRHRSPNAGWPEAAMAGALGLKLAGPRVYGGEAVHDAYMGDGRREATAADIRAALRLYVRACLVQAIVIGAIAVAVSGL